MAISFFCLALINCIEFENKGSVINICLATLFFTLAGLTHKLGSAILFYFSVLPFFYAYLSMNRDNFIVIFKYLIFIIAFLVIFITTNKEILRGYNLPSELNIFRFYSLSLIPLIIYFQEKYTVKNPQRGFYGNLLKGFSLVYYYLALNLSVFYALNLINFSGEALVRVFTLNSFFCLILCGSRLSLKEAILPIYLITINQILFIRSTNLFGGLF